MQFIKYHALGNDYLYLRLQENGLQRDKPARVLEPEFIRWICDRHHGVGADGILVRTTGLSLHDSLSQKQERPQLRQLPQLGVRIYNPDGSEAEKSGNGLRIFARAMFDAGVVGTEPFEVATLGGVTQCQILERGRAVQVDMGQVHFGPTAALANKMIGHIADIGNPHCVIFREAISAAETQQLGPMIETDPRFPKRTNVQFAQVIDRHTLQLEIWERGAGYTLASGSSSCAACAVAVRLGLCDSDIQVHMPGGVLSVTIDQDFRVRQTGPVVRVATIHWHPDEE